MCTLLIETLPSFMHADVCDASTINCGNDVCVSSDARCNGFNDCLNWADELQCG